MTSTKQPEPDVDRAIQYWTTQEASLDGVLGGYGSGSLPRIESLGSRLFLLHLYPELCKVGSALRPTVVQDTQRTRALDVGAGIGRVTGDVLLHLVSDVVLLEPVDAFVLEALAHARASAHPTPVQKKPLWKGLADNTKSVTFLQGTLQSFDPLHPHRATFLDRVGFQPPCVEDETGFDVVWAQWCLGHLNDPDLVAFFRRSQAALRNEKSLIIVKENLCSDKPDGSANYLFDAMDYSLMRSDMAWKSVFKLAGLSLIREQIQDGLEPELSDVKL